MTEELKPLFVKLKWSAKIVNHKGAKRIIVYFDKNEQLIQRIKKLRDAKWSQSLKAWHVPASTTNLKLFKLYTNKMDLFDEDKANHIRSFEAWLKAKRYSVNTIKTYVEALISFLKYFRHQPVSELTNLDVIDYHNGYILKNKLSASYQNQIINAIKLFFGTISNKQIDIGKIHRPRKEHLLPNVLSKEEVKLILNAHSNIKHKVMLSVIYSCGLRRSELLNLKPLDIDGKRNLIIIRQAKGKKDRIVPLSINILDLLRTYYISYKPKTWLFEGQVQNTPYDERSLSNVLKQALVKVGISKPVSLHWLRHSYATHLLENGTDLRYIQEILGHKNSRTTEIYTHVSTKSIQNIKSPYDEL